MKYKREELEEAYEVYFEQEKNQINIFQEMRTGFVNFHGLQSFSGEAATAAKAYIDECHTTVLDTFSMALMELEIRMLALRQDFAGTVDDSGTAILDEDFITGRRNEITNISGDLELVHKNAEAAIDGIRADYSFSAMPKQPVYDGLDATYNKIVAVLGSMRTFNNSHMNDLKELNEMFVDMDKAFAYMEKIITPTGINFTQGETSELDWAQGLKGYQVTAWMYAREADPKLYETFYLTVLVQCGFMEMEVMLEQEGVDQPLLLQWMRDGGDLTTLLMGMGSSIGELSDETVQAWDALKLFKRGLYFTSSVDASTNTVRLNIRTRLGASLTPEQIADTLRSLGGPDASRGQINRLLHGSVIWSDVHQRSRLFNLENFSDAVELANKIKLGQFSGTSTVADLAGIMSKVGKAADVVGKLGDGLTIVLDVADGFYDERTESYGADFDLASALGNVVVDGAIIGGTIWASTAAGAAAGTVVPGLGNLVGAGVGLVVGIGTVLVDELIVWGEPPKSLFEHAKDGLGEVFEDVGDFFGKLFW